MPVELETYTLECPHCKAEVDFAVREVEGLAADIDDENDMAAEHARTETEREFEGMVDPSDLPITPRIIHELSAAIRKGDRFEAELLLDRIAYDLGGEHENACQLGRFSPEARAA